MISIIINAYNAEKHLETTIQSIINQTYSDWELILVDDGSKDDTFRIMKRQSELDSRIRVLKNEKNLGIPRSINLGIDNARGNYIAKIDADDVADSTRLERQIKYLEENPDVDLVGTGGYIINEDGEILNRIKVVKNKCLISRLLRYANPFIHSSIMVKKDALVQVGKYRTGFIHSQDYDLLLRLNEHHSLANLSEPLTYWRFSGLNSTVQKYLLQRACADIAIQFAQERRKNGKDSYDSVDFSELIQTTISKNKMIYEHDFNIYSAVYSGHIKKALFKSCSALAQGYIPRNTISRAIIGLGALF